MHACGNRAPMEIKNKDKWIMIEKRRWASYFSIPMAEGTPKPFPQLTLQTMRAVCAISLFHPEKLADSYAALYEKFWVELEPISKPEVFVPVLQRVLGETDAKEVLDRAGTPEVKQLLTSNTDRAFKSGAFGLPWFLATNAQGEEEGFWVSDDGPVQFDTIMSIILTDSFPRQGVDHLGQVVDHLGLDVPSREQGGFRAML